MDLLGTDTNLYFELIQKINTRNITIQDHKIIQLCSLKIFNM